MNAQANKTKGFTIIEVVLVLAIAALIFLMVFIALPALQRNQRDTARKNDMSRVITAVGSWQGNNRGNLPTLTPTFQYGTQTAAGTVAPTGSLIDRYLRAGGDNFQDPSGKFYTFENTAAAAAIPTTSDATSTAQTTVRIFVTPTTTCNGETLTTGQGNRKVSFRLILEGGGVLCQSN